jgi:hypothetical protein
MKKDLLAVGVVVALGLGAGAASAAPTISPTGIGHTNIIPYFSVQGGNVTLLSITNTDHINGKAVKIRFRGAEWSDSIFDFQVFLSRGDVFTGAVTNSNGQARFMTADGSCTLPTDVNQAFVSTRLQNQTSGTLEGYIEVITMADIVPEGVVAPVGHAGEGYSLYTAVAHGAYMGEAPCKNAATPKAAALVSGLVQDNVHIIGGVDTTDAAQASWMVAPTGSLISYAMIIDVNNSKVFSTLGTAINYAAPVEAYFRQSNDVLTPTVNLTADRLFFPMTPVGAVAPYGGANVTMRQSDMPDLSTAIESGSALSDTAIEARDLLSIQLQKASVISEYSTSPSIQGATDIVLTQPTRRYFYNYNQLPATATTYHALIGTTKFEIYGDALTPYATLRGDVNRIDMANLVGFSYNTAFYDREQGEIGWSGIVGVTPGGWRPPGTIVLRGGVSVVGINISGTTTDALGGTLTKSSIDVIGASGVLYENGWAQLSTTTDATVVGGAYAAVGARLPVIGFTAVNAFNASVGSAGTNYGAAMPLRYVP